MPRKETTFAADAARLLVKHQGDWRAVAKALTRPGMKPPSRGAIVYALKANREKVRYERERRALPSRTNRHPSNPAVPINPEIYKPEPVKPLRVIPDYRTNTTRPAGG